jgi:quercetin dioxygenase-like cupin family protein
MRWRRLTAALFGLVSFAVFCLMVLQVQAINPISGVTVNTLAQGPVKSLPPGKLYINILEFRQQPGSDFGPHAHQASIAYTLQGTDTVSYPTAAAQSVGPGAAAFIPGLAVHTHQNLDGRIGAGAIAAGLVVLVILLCAATFLRGTRRRVTVAMLSILLIAGGALPLIGATSNDYYLIAVRPDSQRILPMPRPDGHVFYSTPDMDPVPAAPYIETLSAISVPTGAIYNAPNAAGPEMIIVMDGAAAVHIGDQTAQLSAGGGAFAQAGQTVAIDNQGSGTLKLIDFAVTGVPAG